MLKVCPKCKTPIRRNLRYSRMIKQARADVEGVKRKLHGDKRTVEAKKSDLKRDIRIHEIRYKATILRKGKTDSAIIDTLGKLSDAMMRHISVQELSAVETKLEMLLEITEFRAKATKDCTIDGSLHTDLQAIIDGMTQFWSSLDHPSEQNVKDWNQEMSRLRAYFQYLKAVKRAGESRRVEVNANLLKIRRIVTEDSPYTEAKKKEVQSLFEEIRKYIAVVTEEERKSIVKAMGLASGHWFKCPNGHYYAIGECGGAMERGKCPECGSVIGGQNHRLESSNRHAPEMDGSSFAAWSEQANDMRNFDLLNL